MPSSQSVGGRAHGIAPRVRAATFAALALAALATATATQADGATLPTDCAGAIAVGPPESTGCPAADGDRRIVGRPGLRFDGAVLPRTTRAAHPNVVVFLADDLNERLYELVDGLQAIADRGMRFRATTPSPLCGPSRASLLTGLHNHNHGIVINGGQNRRIWAERHAGNSLPNWFKAAGYRTVLSGKVLNGCSTCFFGGWDVVIRQDRENRTRRRFYWVDEMAAQVAAEIRVTPIEQPLFVLFAPPSPHAPFLPRPRYAHAFDGSPLIRGSVLDVPSFNEADVSDKRHALILASPLLDEQRIARVVANRERRAAMMLSVTDALEVLLGSLRRAGRLEDTYVFFLSDNGFLEGEHRRPSGKGLPYEEAVTVPMFVLGPDVPAASTSDALVYNHDVTATIVQVAHLVAPELDGRSLAPLWHGDTGPWRQRVLLEHYDRRRGRVFSAVRERRWKAVSLPDGSGETYDLETDPFELSSVDETSGFRAASSDLLQQLLGCKGEACWRAETAPALGDPPSATDRRLPRSAGHGAASLPSTPAGIGDP